VPNKVDRLIAMIIDNPEDSTVSSLYLRQPGLRDQRFHLALGPYGSVY
jgi:hypothetical protein